MPENTQQQQPQQQTTLNIDEVLTALNVVQAEATKWSQVSNTLTKCALFLDNIIKNSQQTSQQEDKKDKNPEKDLVASPATQQEKASA